MKLQSGVLAMLVAATLFFGPISCDRPVVQAGGEEAATADAAAGGLSMPDRDFLIKAEKSEVRRQTLAHVAREKAHSQAVRDYARRAANDNTRALHGIVQLMNQKHLAQPPEVSLVHLQAEERLEHASGISFDRQFISLMAAENQESAGYFDKAANTAIDSDVRSYAARVLPRFRADWTRAAELETQLSDERTETGDTNP